MSKVNSLLKKIALFEKLAMYGDRKSFLQSLAQAEPNQSIDPGYSSNEPNMTPNPNANPNPVPATTVVKIPTSIQSKLNEVLRGKIAPIAVDGVLGSETRGALNAFRKAYNVPAGMSDPQVFQQIETARSLDPATPVGVSPNDLVYDTLKTPGPKAANLFSKIDKFYRLAQELPIAEDEKKNLNDSISDNALPDGRSLASTLSDITNKINSNPQEDEIIKSIARVLSGEIQKTPVNYNAVLNYMSALISKMTATKILDAGVFQQLTKLYNTIKTNQQAKSNVGSTRLIKPIDYRNTPELVEKVKEAVQFLDTPTVPAYQDLYSKIIFNLQGNKSADELYKYLLAAMKRASDTNNDQSRDTLKYLTDFMLKNYKSQ